MTAFLSSFTGWDWFCIFTAWLLLAIAAGVSIGRSIKQADTTEQPEPRDWICTDGQWRTEADAAAWVAETDGSLAEQLFDWPTGEDIPDYVPSEWVA